MRLCGCCKQQSSQLQSVAVRTRVCGYLAMALCSRCRFDLSHWKRIQGEFYETLPVYEKLDECPLVASP